MKGILVRVNPFICGGFATDCTNGGISAGQSEAVLVGPGVPELVEPDGRIVLTLGVIGDKLEWLEETHPQPKRLGWYHARPVNDPRRGHIGWMHGGNSITDDSGYLLERFGTDTLNVHDRQETVKEYEVLSR